MMLDPDANLAEQLRIAARINRVHDRGAMQTVADLLRLAELVESLDQWIRQGGYLPQTWERRRTVDREETA